MSSPQEQSKDLAKHKNKLAQAKYRERQRKKKNDVEQQIAALGKKLARLQAVNQTLESRNSTLEELAAESKQEQVMQDLLEQQSMASRMKAAVDVKEVVMDWAVCLAEYVNATRRYTQPLLTPKELAGHAMSESAVRALRLNFARSVSEILDKAASFTPEVQEEVVNYVCATRAVKERLMRCYCHVDALVWKATVRHAGPSEYDPQVSKSIRLMNLTADQIHALLTAKSEFDASSETICQERISITKEIRRSMGRPENVPRGPESKLSSIAEALQLLGENLNAEGRCLKTLYDACNDIISPIQEAVGMVNALRSGVWFELWDIPCILKQMDLGESISVHQPPPQNLVHSQQNHPPAYLAPVAQTLDPETWRLLSIVSQPSLQPGSASTLSDCSGWSLPAGSSDNE